MRLQSMPLKILTHIECSPLRFSACSAYAYKITSILLDRPGMAGKTNVSRYVQVQHRLLQRDILQMQHKAHKQVQHKAIVYRHALVHHRFNCRQKRPGAAQKHTNSCGTKLSCITTCTVQHRLNCRQKRPGAAQARHMQAAVEQTRPGSTVC